MRSKGVILSLCDLTGHGVKDWVENGYDAILVDPQHTFDNHCQIIEIKEGHGIITRVDQKNIRSATPRGISKAIYLYNAPHLQEL